MVWAYFFNRGDPVELSNHVCCGVGADCYVNVLRCGVPTMRRALGRGRNGPTPDKQGPEGVSTALAPKGDGGLNVSGLIFIEI